jgi:polysaccharide pyruvyl transferase WcaK-like protein
VKPVKVFFVNDSSANPNWGSRATSYLLKQHITEAGGELKACLPLLELSHPNWQMTAQKRQFYKRSMRFLERSSFATKAGSSVLNRVISKLPDIAPENWSEFELKAQQVLKGQILEHVKAALLDCDMVLINGEGGILENQRESRMMLFIAYVAKKHFNKPVALVCHTADLSQANLFEIAQQVYPLIDDVVFRDPVSLERYAEMSQGRFAADITFTLEPAPFEPWVTLASRRGYFDTYPTESFNFDPSKPFICLGGSSSFSARHKASSPKKALTNLAKNLAKLAQVVLVASALPDERIFEPIARELALPFVPLATAPLQGLDLLSHSSLYVGGRWHGAIFALRGGTPVIGFGAETFKLDALLSQFNLNSPFKVNALEEQTAPLIALAQVYLAQGLELKESLKQKAETFAKTSPEHLALIKKLAKV